MVVLGRTKLSKISPGTNGCGTDELPIPLRELPSWRAGGTVQPQ